MANVSAVWPIQVNSLGRPNGATFAALDGLPYEVIVEPREEGLYRAAGHAHVVVLPENGRGLAYSRNFGLDRAADLDWYWLLDDDIKAFYTWGKGKTTKRCSAEDALLAAQQLARPGVGQVSLDYQQFIWSATKPFSVNSYQDNAVGNAAGVLTRLGVRYDESFSLKVDRDFSIQCVYRGLDVVRRTDFAFHTPTDGTITGGLQADYALDGFEKDNSRRLAEKWPWCVVPVTKPNGREDAKIFWKRIRQGRAAPK